MKLAGIYSPIATPFDHEGALWKAKVEHNVGKWNKVALAGYVVCGSTGESVMLTSEEKQRLWEWVAQYSAADKLLIAGTGMESVRETVALTNIAAEMGYKAAMIRTPHYYKNLLGDEAQKLFFRTVADQVKVPVIIYNWPEVTGIDISIDAVAALSEHPNIVGVKESSGDLEKLKRMIENCEADFSILTGFEPGLLDSLQQGASGAILAFANAAPYALLTIWEAFRTRDQDLARDWQDRVAQAARLTPGKYGVPGLKYAMDLNGYFGGQPRLPLLPPGTQVREEIQAALDGLKG